MLHSLNVSGADRHQTTKIVWKSLRDRFQIVDLDCVDVRHKIAINKATEI